MKPPFRAEDMQGLYKKVLKGQYPRVPSVYSADLSSMIKLMLQVSPHMRPDAEKILNNPIFNKKVHEMKLMPFDEINNELLNTIKIPKNL